MDLAASSVRWWIVLVCLAALVGKLKGRSALAEFRGMLVAVRVPARLVVPVGAVIVSAELLIVVLGPWHSTGAVAMGLATALFAVLTVGVAVAVARQVTAACRCFGGSGGQLSTVHVIRNAVLTVVAAAAVVVSAAAPGDLDLGTAVVGMVAAVVAAAVIVRWEDLAALFVDVPGGSPPGGARHRP